MKTAICFSGELRSIDKTYDYIKERILSRFSDYDIFYHTWDDDPDLHKLSIIENDPRTKSVLVEARVNLPETNLVEKARKEVNIQGMLRQLYCLQRVNELKKQQEVINGSKYDIVMRLRPDIQPVYCTTLEKNVETWDMKDYLYTSDHDNHHGYNDRLYFSNSENMDFLSDRIDILEYYRSLGGTIHYETFFKFCVDYKGLDVCRTRLMFVLLRTTGVLSTELGQHIDEIKFI